MYTESFLFFFDKVELEAQMKELEECLSHIKQHWSVVHKSIVKHMPLSQPWQSKSPMTKKAVQPPPSWTRVELSDGPSEGLMEMSSVTMASRNTMVCPILRFWLHILSLKVILDH